MDYKEEEYTTFSFGVMFSLFCSITSAIALAILKKYLKNLNDIIKNIIFALSLQNLASSAISTIILLFWINTNEICTVLDILLVSNAHITIDTLALMSFTKFYLSWKTAKLEAINILLLVGLTLFLYLFGYSIATFGSLVMFTPFKSSCLDDTDKSEINWIAPFLNMIAAIPFIIVGLVYDVSLYFFLKKRNQIERDVGQAEIIPWKTSNDEEYKYTVPIGASAIALVTGLIVCVVGTTIALNNVKSFEMVLAIGYILPSILLIVMLGLTVRTAWNQNPKPCVQKKLWFHDENDVDVEGIGEEQGEVNEGFEAGEVVGDEEISDQDETIPEEDRGANGSVKEELSKSKIIFVRLCGTKDDLALERLNH